MIVFFKQIYTYNLLFLKKNNYEIINDHRLKGLIKSYSKR